MKLLSSSEFLKAPERYPMIAEIREKMISE